MNFYNGFCEHMAACPVWTRQMLARDVTLWTIKEAFDAMWRTVREQREEINRLKLENAGLQGKLSRQLRQRRPR